MDYLCLVGKYDKFDGWLPLVIHLRDTAAVMKRIVRYWVADSQIKACRMSEVEFAKVAILAAELHDTAKASATFQGLVTKECPYLADRLESEGFFLYNSNMYKGKTPHSEAGQFILQSEYFRFPESFAAVIGAHHGMPAPDEAINGCHNMIQTYAPNFFGDREDRRKRQCWVSAWQSIVDDAMQTAGYANVNEIPELSVEAQILLSALLIMADWIASNTYYFPLIDIHESGSDIDFEKRVQEGWDKLQFPQNWESEVRRMNETIFYQRFHFCPNDVQKVVYRAANEAKDPGIYILEAQMGVGKTEAALGAAEVIASKCHSKGIFFGLPTQATCNGIYDRLFSWADTVSEDTLNAIILAHGGAIYDQEYQKQVLQGKAQIFDEETESGTVIHPWFTGRKKALLADFVIGTVDQFLMASLNKKHFMLRHLGLAGKVVIIDEVHSYDKYMNTYLCKSLEWMGTYGVPVILLSATLPASVRTEFIESYLRGRKVKKVDEEGWKNSRGYPLLTWTDGRSIFQREIHQDIKNKAVKVSCLAGSDSVVKIIANKLKEGGCASVILNTVKDAQSYYALLKNAFPEWDILLYHAQFTMDDRLEKEKTLLQKMGKHSTSDNRNRFILVGTQVLEQSLDYDADVMITQLCPIDLLLQRMGRLHRHQRIDRPYHLQNPECYVILDGDEKMTYNKGTEVVYGDYLLKRTLQVLPDYIHIPKDIPRLVQQVYDEQDDLDMNHVDGYEVAKQYYMEMTEKKGHRAQTYLLNRPRTVITGMMINQSIWDSEDGVRCVRDAGSSIEVILLREDAEGYIHLKTSLEEKCLSTEGTLDEDTSYQISRHRVRLPNVFTQGYIIRDVIRELQDRQKRFSLWEASGWLKGELILLLDSDYSAELCGYRLSYSKEKGLQYQKKGE